MLSSTSFLSFRYAAGLLPIVAGFALTAPAVCQNSGAAAVAAPTAQTAGTVTTPAQAEVADPVSVAPVGSQVRIVRLSQVRGLAQLNRNTGRGFESAFANIPVIAGAELRTGQGIAEVEFEDNSSLRLAPGTEVRFTTLSRMPNGGTVTQVDLLKGMVYADAEKTRGNLFVLVDGSTKLTVAPGAHLRLNATDSKAELAVLEGQTYLEMNGSTTVVSKHQSVVLDTSAETMSEVKHGVQETAFDGWDKQEADYHKQKSGLASSGGFGLYGANDLNYYGSFTNMPGCGSLWRPYFASAAWDPFANGVWAWYPNAGYSWVSPYPWGWLPFHSGSWVSCGGAGWGWQPAGQWYGLSNSVAMRIARHPIHPMPTPPAPHTGPTLVPVNTKQLTVSGVGRPGSTTVEAFTFRRDSAGLGVPRSTFGNLRGIATNAERHGLGSATVGAPSYSGYSSGAVMGRGVGGAPTNASAGSHGSYSPHSSGSTSMSGGGHSGSFSAPAAASAPMSAPSGGAVSGGGAHK